ncbi:MAG TPA: hypothetical protein VFX59_26150 [Polyangiales bacterium]|nr:hypothetical protein [Polyangiales bacterium]
MYRSLALIWLAGCGCMGSNDQLVKLHVEVPDTDGLRDARAITCWSSANGRVSECATGLLGVGRSGVLRFTSASGYSLGASVSLDTPDPNARGTLLLAWKPHAMFRPGSALAAVGGDQHGRVIDHGLHRLRPRASWRLQHGWPMRAGAGTNAAHELL